MLMNKFLFLFLTLFLVSCNSFDKRPLIGKTPYQQQLNSSFKDATTSPLLSKDLKNFKGLDFFAVDSSFIVKATFTPIQNAPIFEMPTTTERAPLYKEFGVVSFTLQNKPFQLTLYQSQDDLKDDKYKDYLFLPFTDNTSGYESYGAGRYMDIMLGDITENNTVVLNFNNTYNPYCAYNEKYSCPLTPRKNHLDIEVKVGVKTFKKY